MKIETIIELLLKHELSKYAAIEALKDVINGFKNVNAIDFEVIEVAFTVESNHAILKIKKSYGYDEIKGKMSQGDKVSVFVNP